MIIAPGGHVSTPLQLMQLLHTKFRFLPGFICASDSRRCWMVCGKLESPSAFLNHFKALLKSFDVPTPSMYMRPIWEIPLYVINKFEITKNTHYCNVLKMQQLEAFNSLGTCYYIYKFQLSNSSLTCSNCNCTFWWQ